MERKKRESEYQKLLMERYGYLENDKENRTTLQMLYCDPQEEGYEEEMLEWVKAHPDASFQELVAFDFSFYEPLEIVDDDELDDGEWEG